MENSETPGRGVEIISTQEQIRSATSSALSGVRFYTLEREDRLVIVYSQIPKPINTTSYLLRFVEKPIGEMTPLIDVRFINSLELTGPGTEPTASVIIDMSPQVSSLIYDDFFAFSDPRFDAIRTWIIAARMLRQHGNVLFSKPITNTYHEPNAVDRVDLKQFVHRDLNKMAETIANPRERLEFRNMIRCQYLETLNEGVPPSETVYSISNYWGSENSNYATYKIPIFDIEKYLIESAHAHFGQLYMHPVEMLRSFASMETDITRISSETRAKASGANRNIRVPRPLIYTVDVVEYYESTMSLKELHMQLDGMMTFPMIMRNMSSEMSNLQRTLRVSAGVSSGVDILGTCVNIGGFSKIVDTIFRANVNPNLFYIDIVDLGANLWRNPFTFIALRTFTAMIPATALLPSQRRQMNNITILNILYHKLDSSKFQRLYERVRDSSGGILLPDISNFTSWSSHDLDLMQVIYYYGRDLLQSAAYSTVRSLIRYHYNEVEEHVNQMDVEIPGGGVEPMSLCTPFYTGVSPVKYARDREYDGFRRARHMKENGVLLPNAVTDYMLAADTTVLDRIIRFATMFFNNSSKTAGVKASITGMTPEQLKILTEYIETMGIERILMLPRIFNGMRATFSTSIAADGYVRNINAMKRRYISINSRYMVTGFLMIEAGTDICPEISVQMYGGTHVAYTMQMFKTLYKEIQNRCGLLAGDYVTQGQLVTVTTALMKVFFETPDFDPKEIFGYEDAGQWRRFLESPSVPISEIPVLQNFMDLISRIEPMLKSDYLLENVVPRFFITCGAFSRSNNTIMAMNSVPRSRLKVIHEIRSPRDYQQLTSSSVRDGPEHGTEFDDLWYNKILCVDPTTQYTNETVRIPAIRVLMNARVITNMIFEQGNFPISQTSGGSNIDDFHTYMNLATNDQRFAKMLVINHTVIINDIGTYGRPDLMPLARRRDSLLSRLPRLCMMVPAEDVKIRILTYHQFLDRIDNSATFRKDAYEMWNDFKVGITRSYQPK